VIVGPGSRKTAVVGEGANLNLCLGRFEVMSATEGELGLPNGVELITACEV